MAKFKKEAAELGFKIGIVAGPLILPYLEGGVDVPMEVVLASVLIQFGDDLDKFKSMIGK